MTNRSHAHATNEDRSTRQPAGRTARLAGLAIAGTIAVATSTIVALTPSAVAANDNGRRECSNRTLRGDYGLVVSGIRGLGPDVTESFIGTAIRTYDGKGGFAQVDNSHGEITGAVVNEPATGTYTVNANCSGTSTIYFPGAPPLETSFVIVDDGQEVKDIVMAPQPNLVTAELRRVGS